MKIGKGRRWTCAFAAAAVFAGTAVVVVRAQSAGTDQQACIALAMSRIPVEMIGLPTKGAEVKSAQFIAATAQTKAAPTPFNPSGVTLARPAYCEVKGEILPVDPAAPVIRFQVNLPSDWNGKAMQLGGGGYDGTVAAATGALPRASDTTPYPITRGFATFGSDGGHEGNDATFATNQEALTNFAYAQLKKAHDVAMALIMARYHRAPLKTYFVGQSEGGREGLTVAQRFPQDYDGIVVTAPAINYTNLMLRFNDASTALARPGGFLGTAQIKAFGDAVLAQCDMNDGVKDGIVGDYLGCNVDRSALQCKGDTGDACLTQPQLAALATIYDPKDWKDASGKTIASYPRFLVGGGEAAPGGMSAWITGRAPLPRPQPAGKAFNAQQLGLGIGAFYGNSAVRYLVVKDPAFDSFDFKPQQYAQQTIQAVQLLASNDPNLAVFQKRGGKLIILHNTSDLAVSPIATMTYYEAMVKKLGKNTVDQFARLYIVPSGDHGGGGDVPSKVDLLGMLDQWVDHGRAPGEDAIAQEFGADRNVTRAKPLCMYPNYPRYVGSGDPNAAASYRCTHTAGELAGTK
jgi:pimeloyl-ACP methyl ester carboxylesterase